MLAKNPAEWRKIVLKQGNYTCQKCGTEGTIYPGTNCALIFPYKSSLEDIEQSLKIILEVIKFRKAIYEKTGSEVNQ